MIRHEIYECKQLQNSKHDPEHRKIEMRKYLKLKQKSKERDI